MSPQFSADALRPIALLVLAVALICLALHFAQAAEPASEVKSKKENIVVEDLESLAATIEDEAKREEFLKHLRAVIAVEKDSDEDPKKRTVAAALNTWFAEAAKELSITEDAFNKRLTDWLILKGWVNRLGDDASFRARGTEQFGKFLLIVSAALLAYGIAWLVLKPLRGVINRRKSDNEITRIACTFARALVLVVPIATFVITSNMLIASMAPNDDVQTSVNNIMLAIVAGSLLVTFVRLVFVPPTPEMQFLSVDSESGQRALTWAWRLAAVLVGGFLIISIPMLFNFPDRALPIFDRLVKLILTLFVITVIISKRRRVADWIRKVGQRGKPNDAKAKAVHLLAAVWHWIAIGYAVGIFATVAYRIEGGFALMIRGTLLTLAVLIAAYLSFRLLRMGTDRLYVLAFSARKSLPRLKSQLERYVPPFSVLLRVVIAIGAVVSILEAWEIEAYDWLFSERNSDLLAAFLSILLIWMIGIVVWEFISASIERYLTKTDRDGNVIERGARAKTLLPLLRKVVLVVLTVMLLLITLSELGIEIAPLLAGAGIIGLAIGFGAQKFVQDIITGFFILVEDAIAIGDVVNVAGIGGVVEDLSVRSIRLRDLSGNVHTIPFSSVDTVTNMTKEFSFYLLEIGVAYREDTDQVAEVCRQILEEMRAESEFAPLILAPLEVLGVDKFADSAVIIKARIKTVPIKQWFVGREFNRRMKKRFDQLGIEIPFPHRTLYFGIDRSGDAPPARIKVDSFPTMAPRPDDAVEAEEPGRSRPIASDAPSTELEPQSDR